MKYDDYHFENSKYKLKILLILLITTTTFLMFTDKANASTLTRVYDTKITSIQSGNGADWIVKGITKAPDGTKIYVTTANKHDESYGTNVASNKNQIGWATVNDGKFYAHVDSISLTESVSYKSGTKYRVYVFAAKGGIKSFINSGSTKPLSNRSMSKVAKATTKKTLVLSEAQAKYINGLNSNNDSSSSSNLSTSSNFGQDADKKYEKKVNSLISGTAQSASYNESTNTLTYTGFEAWKDYSDDDLQYSMDILETVANRQSIDYGLQHNPIIKVVLPDGTLIAESDGTNDIEFTK